MNGSHKAKNTQLFPTDSERCAVLNWLRMGYKRVAKTSSSMLGKL